MSTGESGPRVEPIDPPAECANDLERYFFHRNRAHTTLKWRHYFEIYERHLGRYRGQPVTLVEIGVFKGGSLHMWRAYFGDAARIWGIDSSPKAAQLRAEGFEILVGDQADPAFLREVVRRVPRPDILIDDGGHRMEQQITTFEVLFPWIADEGVYVCEDLHTSYWPEFGGGFRSPASTIEHSKHWIDALNAWHSRDAGHVVSDFTRTAWSMHYYDSMLVVEKRRMREPESLVSGAGRVFRVLQG